MAGDEEENILLVAKTECDNLSRKHSGQQTVDSEQLESRE